MAKGTVKWFSEEKGFGFITGDDKEDYFVHMSGLREHLQSKGLRTGQKVSFDVHFGMKGDKAINVRVD